MPGVYSIRSKTRHFRTRGTISTGYRRTNAASGTGPDLGLAVAALEAHKALDIVVLDLREVSNATDYFVIASGSSDIHVRALAEHVLEALRVAGRRTHHVEGVAAGRWALLDFVDVVIHIFHPTMRAYYQLERLWADAPLVPSQPHA